MFLPLQFLSVRMSFYLNFYFFVNSLPDNIFLCWSKFKAHADEKMTSNLNFVLGRVENILKKRGNASFQHFLIFSK